MSTRTTVGTLVYAQAREDYGLSYPTSVGGDTWSSTAGDSFAAEHLAGASIAADWGAFGRVGTENLFDFMGWAPSPAPVSTDGPRVRFLWGAAQTGAPHEPEFEGGPSISTEDAFVEVKMKLSEAVPSFALNIVATWEFDFVNPGVAPTVTARQYLHWDPAGGPIIDDPVVDALGNFPLPAGVVNGATTTYTWVRSYPGYKDLASFGSLPSDTSMWGLSLWAIADASTGLPSPGSYGSGRVDPGVLHDVRLSVVYEVADTPVGFTDPNALAAGNATSRLIFE